MDEIAFSKRRHIAASSKKAKSKKAKSSNKEPVTGVDPDDYPDVYLTNWYGISYAAICFTKNMEGTINLIILLAMGKFGCRDRTDIEEWIDGHLKGRENGEPPSVSVAPIPGFEKMLGGEAMQALGTSLAFWIDAAILRQRANVHVAWPSLMQAQLHLGRAMGPITARELVLNAAKKKERKELKEAVLAALTEMPGKSMPTLSTAFMRVMVNDRVKKVQRDNGMDDEKLFGYLEYAQKNTEEVRSEFGRVTEGSRGAPSADRRKKQESMLSEIVESDSSIYKVIREKVDRHKK